MSLQSSWKFVGDTDGVGYRLYDWLRQGVSRRLADYLHRHSTRAALNTESPAKVWALEAGSGPGSTSTVLHRRSVSTRSVCLDLDPEALKEAGRRDPALYLVIGDIRQMPFRDGTFTIVFNSSTVEHLEEPVIAVSEMRRVCKADGRVFVGVPYAAGPLAFQPLISQSSLGQWLGPVFNRRSLRDLLQHSGLKPIEFTRYFAWFFIGAVARPASNHAPEKPYALGRRC